MLGRFGICVQSAKGNVQERLEDFVAAFGAPRGSIVRPLVSKLQQCDIAQSLPQPALDNNMRHCSSSAQDRGVVQIVGMQADILPKSGQLRSESPNFDRSLVEFGRSVELGSTGPRFVTNAVQLGEVCLESATYCPRSTDMKSFRQTSAESTPEAAKRGRKFTKSGQRSPESTELGSFSTMAKRGPSARIGSTSTKNMAQFRPNVGQPGRRNDG